MAGSSSTVSDFARESLLETTPAAHVGTFIDIFDEPSKDPQVIIKTHTFECTNVAYPGWYWAVTIATISGEEPTVSEINLLPGAAALVPTAWTPWAERVQPGDLGVGDLLPAPKNDTRLTAGFTAADEDAAIEQLLPPQWELGLGREQVLSVEGIDRAVNRWFAGPTSPRSAMAKSAPAPCSSCGYLMAIGGSLGQAFGVCANEFGAADGQVVAMNYGCGAHSSVKPDFSAPVPVIDLVIDDEGDELADGSQLEDYVADVPVESDENESDDLTDEVEDLADDVEDDASEEAVLDYIDHLDEDTDVEQHLFDEFGEEADDDTEDSED